MNKFIKNNTKFNLLKIRLIPPGIFLLFFILILFFACGGNDSNSSSPAPAAANPDNTGGDPDDTDNDQDDTNGDSTLNFSIGNNVKKWFWSGVPYSYYEECALLGGEGNAYCWSYGSTGSLSDSGYNFKDFSHGNKGVYCGIVSSNGELYCQEENATYITPTNASGFQKIVTDLKFVKIELGVDFICGLTEEGSLYCWGNNDYGQLGNDSTTNRNTPPESPVNGELKFGTFDATTSDYSHSACAVTIDYETYCWGDNSNGQLGLGNNTSPIKIPMRVQTDTKFRQISVGGAFACAVDQSGDIYCWGGTADGSDEFIKSNTPVKIEAGDIKFTTVGIARSSSYLDILRPVYALSEDGKLYVFGLLNDLETTEQASGIASKIPLKVNTDISFIGLIFGSRSNSCAVSEDKELYCWGGYFRLLNGRVTVPTEINWPSTVNDDSVFLP